MARLLLLLLTSLFLGAGSLSGVVVDPAGAMIANAKVAVLSENSNRTEVKSDQVGRFVFADLKPGIYSIEISFPGFLDKKIAGLRVGVAEETRVPTIELSVAAIQVCDYPPVDVYKPTASGRSELSGIVSFTEQIALSAHISPYMNRRKTARWDRQSSARMDIFASPGSAPVPTSCESVSPASRS